MPTYTYCLAPIRTRYHTSSYTNKLRAENEDDDEDSSVETGRRTIKVSTVIK